MRPYKTVYTTAYKVHSTSELNWFYMIAIRPIRFKYELYMVICHFYTFSVESSRIREAKPSKRVNFISKHTLKDFKNAKNENYYFLHPNHF